MKNIVFLLAMGLLLFSCGPQENPDPVIPSVTTGDVTDITTTTAFCGGNVTADGGAAVIARGVCWSTLENPTTSDSKTTDDLAQRTKAEDGTGLGTYTSHVTGLSPNTTYYVRAYATNANGTAYGEQRTFTTNAQQGMPSVTTADVIDITTTTATCGGNVTSDGGSSVTARGVCWSTSQNPTTSNSKTTNGTGVGSYTSNITGLSPNTTYYVRAYATNSEGTAYGEQKTFSTNAQQATPSVTTGDVINITATTATCDGNVTADGGLPVIARGVCWSTTQNPTTANSKTTNGTGLGTYTSNITGLSPNTTYYVRAYATNANGTAYGEQRTFKSQQEQGSVFGSFTDSRDGNHYETVTIGSQVWMAENLAYLPSVVGPETGSEYDGYEAYPFYYVYGYDGASVATAKATANYTTYGVLYNWPAAITACPEGWHLPSDAEWKQLEMYLGITSAQADATGWRGTAEGGKLKEEGTTHWDSPNTGATNSSGFTALPGGYRSRSGVFYDIGLFGLWWSSTELATDTAWLRSLGYSIGLVSRYDYDKDSGYSVRCLRD